MSARRGSLTDRATTLAFGGGGTTAGQGLVTASQLARDTLGLLLLLGIASIPGAGKSIAMLILLAAAWQSPIWTMKSLIASTIVIFLNPAIGSGDVGVLKWILLFLAIGCSFRSRVKLCKRSVRVVTLWGFMTLALLANSLFISPTPLISLLKTISFSAGILCIVRLAILTRNKTTEILVFVAETGIAVTIASIPLLRFGPGYFNGSGFNGVLNQPQALAIFLVMTGAAAFAASWRVTQSRGALIFLGAVQWWLIYPTRSRTALLAIVFGSTFFCLELLGRRKWLRGHFPLRSAYVARTVAGFVIVGALAASVSSEFREGVGSFIRKGDATTNNSPLSLRGRSREEQVDHTLLMARQHPVFGVGFGVGSDSAGQNTEDASSFLGIPITAPVEQGFFPLATIAQIGITGSTIVMAFLASLYLLARRDSSENAALFSAVLGINLGEMVFYSFGGLGMLMWVILLTLSVSGAYELMSPITSAKKYKGDPSCFAEKSLKRSGRARLDSTSFRRKEILAL